MYVIALVFCFFPPSLLELRTNINDAIIVFFCITESCCIHNFLKRVAAPFPIVPPPRSSPSFLPLVSPPHFSLKTKCMRFNSLGYNDHLRIIQALIILVLLLLSFPSVLIKLEVYSKALKDIVY